MLDEQRLAKKIENVFNECQNENDDPDSSKLLLAQEIAKAIVEEIKMCKVVYVSGLVAPPGGGNVTGQFNCNIY